METNINSLVIMKSYYEAIKDLEDTDQLIMLKAIMEFGFNGIEPSFDKKYLNGYWKLISPTLARGIETYKSKVANGSKGGRPKASSTEMKKEVTPAPTKSETPKVAVTQKQALLIKRLQDNQLGQEDTERFVYMIKNDEITTVLELDEQISHMF